ncbi:cop9 signalosome complex subunit 8-like [Plakobranchus ocellatus]|uniref:COP9 signalosome complex subunit 8 n=1 Tax=Plakobranchus ocellatus TaxID=259542 RepID=A0AAV3ZZQ1_9GAST|nr:cop9 signalosome complex subunit 8-like [Plakobranchus ocellatus]
MAAVAVPDFQQLSLELEKQELENGNSPCTATQYSQLLALYLLQNDLCNAKFLWKRIPQTVRQGCPELNNIWAVGQKMWLKDYTGTYEALQKEWSDDVKGIMTAVQDSVRERALRLVRLAYSSIGADDFATFVGMPADKAIQAAQGEGWDVDLHNRIIIPKKLESPVATTIMSDQHLSVLTDYVTFMEN